jgi:hypothetical protein
MTIPPPPVAVYDAMVALYRKYDKNDPNGVRLSTHTAVAKTMNIPSAVVRKAWARGWPGSPGMPGMLPIREVIFREKQVGRARRNSAMKAITDTKMAELKTAVDDQARARALEGLAVRQGMMVAAELQNSTLQMLLAAQRLRESTMAALQEIGEDPTTPMSKRLAIANTLSEIAERDSKTLERMQTVERRFMGEIESRQKIEGAAAETSSPETLFDDLAGLFRAFGVAEKVSQKPLPAIEQREVIVLPEVPVAEKAPET